MSSFNDFRTRTPKSTVAALPQQGKLGEKGRGSKCPPPLHPTHTGLLDNTAHIQDGLLSLNSLTTLWFLPISLSPSPPNASCTRDQTDFAKFTVLWVSFNTVTFTHTRDHHSHFHTLAFQAPSETHVTGIAWHQEHHGGHVSA